MEKNLNARQIRDTNELYCANLGWNNLEGFERYTNLSVLWVNGNNLSSIEGLEVNFRITALFAHDNRIDTLNGSLSNFKFLETLHLQNNKLNDIEHVLGVLGRFQYLKHLDLFGNPVAEEGNFRMKLIHAIPSLEVLDRHVVTNVERMKAKSMFKKSSPSKKNRKPRLGSAKVDEISVIEGKLMKEYMTITTRRRKEDELFKQSVFGSRSGSAEDEEGKKSVPVSALDPKSAQLDRPENGLNIWEIAHYEGLIEDLATDNRINEIIDGMMGHGVVPIRVLDNTIDTKDLSKVGKSVETIINKKKETNEDYNIDFMNDIIWKSMSFEELNVQSKKLFDTAESMQTRLLDMGVDDENYPKESKKALQMATLAGKLKEKSKECAPKSEVKAVSTESLSSSRGDVFVFSGARAKQQRGVGRRTSEDAKLMNGTYRML
eukprot:TRINITY_DN782349_c0_g1_i1.p1 TRINITY_DN782349_c0_g1~~TRINITY_DN782349_c0_g1_i1.p1  ORF type:complete len:433 (+),score=102.11 TRINITY_DN782349_c0_g1_i1:121-1419(+)